MPCYPVSLDIRGRRCLVVGGGAVATRKVRALIRCGARVTVVTPAASSEIETLAESRRIELKARIYRSGDMEGMFLVFSATDSRPVNSQVHADACQHNILCNIADQPAACNFTVPAVVRRGDLMLTVSTAGKSPALSRRLRKVLEAQFGPEYGEALRLMGAIRTRLLGNGHAPDAHRKRFRSVLDRDLIGLIRRKDIGTIDRILLEIFGPGYTFESLITAEADT
ncbi:siroheme synthase [Desulfonema ishimotonii]|uniref:precorrin-2 dehydrogenase n=2 Tax=Desulfonema ishimotonii TaxID=45657 RepID=A0A401G1U4_9BACT|nr:siroheme synthase [Desulfonema ishimotonii]